MSAERIDKRDVILDAAEKLFSRKGFDAASTRAIAAEANVNMAMISYYFGSKEGLFKQLLERRISGFRQTLIALNDEPISSWEKLERCIDMYTDRILGANCFSQVIHHEITLQQRTEMSDFITDILMKNALEICRILSDGIANGTFRAVDPELTVASIFGTKYYVVSTAQLASKLVGIDLRDPANLEAIKPRIKRHLHDLLKAHLTPHD